MKHLLCLVLLVGCGGGSSKLTLSKATAATIAAVDVSYDLAVELCDAKEKAIIARPASTLETDRAAMAQVRATCDRMFAVFEETRKLSALAKELEQIQ